ncbi:MAG: extracellular solute-binding protein [Chloroflexi bacterium]|nr:extracellular solute-binding protein [Chloroflexota bacterium]MCL5109529.1 extracellular solute-binding protein [Chloroflexota bacterium]
MADPTQKHISRRQLLKLSAVAAGGALLAACSNSSPAPAQPASTQAPAKSSGPLTLSVWISPSFNETADAAIGNVFKEWGGKNNASIDFQVVPEAERRQRYTAAIEGKKPPDIAYTFEAELQYYRAQNLVADCTDFMTEMAKLEGGLFESAYLNVAYQGKYYGVPYVVNPWVNHVRTDLLKQAGVDYPKTWQDVVTISDKVSKPPQVYTYAMSLGDNNDTSNNFLVMAWAYGAQLQTPEGGLSFQNPGMVDAIKLVKEMFDKKVIPPGATTWDSSGNNKAYQSKQAVLIHNPNSVYAQLESDARKADASQEAKDLLANTGMYGMPAGPKGAFDMVDVRAFVAFKDGKDPAASKNALKYFIDPKNYEKVIETGLNRWAPVYKNMMDRPLWQKEAYKNYKQLMTNGRAMAYGGPPNAAMDEVLNSWLISRMLQEVCTSGKDPQKALDDARAKMAEIYKKWKLPA